MKITAKRLKEIIQEELGALYQRDEMDTDPKLAALEVSLITNLEKIKASNPNLDEIKEDLLTIINNLDNLE